MSRRRARGWNARGACTSSATATPSGSAATASRASAASSCCEPPGRSQGEHPRPQAGGYPMSHPAFDHLVVAARTLDEGVAWCEATLGIVPTAGGKHVLMGTHNRVFSIATPAWPRAYFEIIAIDPVARPPGRTRWFDLDDAALQAALARGPQLIHWAMGCDDIDDRCRRLAALGVDRGRVLEAERMTPDGLLRWRISVRDDGERLAGGALPTLIQWGERHPADTMPAGGVTLQRVEVAGLPADVTACCDVPGVDFVAHGAPLRVWLATPPGPRAPSFPSLRGAPV